jgi:protein-S-isoprenylcysteine O-methyltransferase Ste14
LADVPSLGHRGGGWVVLQSVLVAAIFVLGVAGPAWPSWAHWPLKVAGVLLVAAGAVVMVTAARALGAGFTPFPRPRETGTLVDTGPYAVVRHPVYAGGILVFSGISLALSPWALVGTAALAVLWALKSHLEERFLAVRYPAYAGYRARTRYRLVPFVY